ncbi:hypothetical protein K457DRAFT_1821001 [Linnemannia elongata AG-77]|uniref:Crinkler effector protein N-terminal domain-containing protein n=1 Tax=Linnemannia elongata AG-77 TaxID=1314771 RepID=A0A197JRZ1_9FUNG|nr:hypothetical protein K457DRAFT_1821001 [Linnemannia elongata AG-77]
MTYNHLTLFCLVDGESASSVFPVKLPMDDSIGDLKKLIKTEKAPEFDDIAADKLTLWRVSISVATNKHKLIVLNEFESAAELDPTDDVSDVFPEAPPKKTIHIIVQRPPPAMRVTPESASCQNQEQVQDFLVKIECARRWWTDIVDTKVKSISTTVVWQDSLWGNLERFRV